MKIEGPKNSAPKTPPGVTAAKVKEKLPKEADSGRPSSATEKVDVSSGAKALQAARAPEVPDQEKIARLRDAIANGEFKIDVSKIADRILEEEF